MDTICAAYRRVSDRAAACERAQPDSNYNFGSSCVVVMVASAAKTYWPRITTDSSDQTLSGALLCVPVPSIRVNLAARCTRLKTRRPSCSLERHGAWELDSVPTSVRVGEAKSVRFG